MVMNGTWKRSGMTGGDVIDDGGRSSGKCNLTFSTLI
jgi:hypothetical protein